VQGVPGGAVVRHQHGVLRVRRGHLSERLLHCERDVRALRLRVQHVVRDRRRDVRRVRGGTGVQRERAVRLRRSFLPERLLQR
jgi:hypothetical protein